MLCCCGISHQNLDRRDRTAHIENTSNPHIQSFSAQQKTALAENAAPHRPAFFDNSLRNLRLNSDTILSGEYQPAPSWVENGRPRGGDAVNDVRTLLIDRESHDVRIDFEPFGGIRN